MRTYPTRIASVVSHESALVLRFHHPADIRVPQLNGFGIGQEWMKPESLRGIEKALVDAAGATDLDDLQGRLVTVTCDRKGTLEGLVFEDDVNYQVVWFPDFCKP